MSIAKHTFCGDQFSISMNGSSNGDSVQVRELYFKFGVRLLVNIIKMIEFAVRPPKTFSQQQQTF